MTPDPAQVAAETGALPPLAVTLAMKQAALHGWAFRVEGSADGSRMVLAKGDTELTVTWTTCSPDVDYHAVQRVPIDGRAFMEAVQS